MRTKQIWKLLFIIIILIGSIGISSAEERKYPPYPDVWGYELPWPKKDSMRSNVEVAKMDNGDFMVTYTRKIIETRRSDKSCCNATFVFEGILFFKGIRKTFTVDRFNEFWKINHGKRVKTEKVIFKDGSTIEEVNVGAGGNPDPFYSYYIIKKNRQGKIVDEKMLLYLYDKPQKVKIDKYVERNWDYKRNHYLKRVENIFPDFVPLDDETFLIYYIGGNFIVRFDKNFKTESDLINKKIFLVDRKKIYDELEPKNGANDQINNNVLAEYLLNIKNGGGKP